MSRNSKRKKPAPRRSEKRPSNENLWVPISVPSATGDSKLMIGEGTLRNGLIVLKLKDTLGSVAVQRLFERGAILGLEFVMLQTDEENQAKQEALAREAKDREDLRLLNEDKIAHPENYSAEEVAEVHEVLSQARQIIDEAAEETEIVEGVTVDEVISEEAVAGLAAEGYDVPVYLGEPGEEDRPQVGWAKIASDGTAEVVWEGEPPFDMGTKVHTSIAEDEISFYAAEDDDEDAQEMVPREEEVSDEAEENDNKENN